MTLLKKVSGFYYLGFLIWGLILILRKLEIYIPFINNHLTDLYTIPMYCYTIEILMNGLGYQWKPDLKFVLISAINITVTFEIVCPFLSDKFVGDFIDVICYFVGGILFFAYRRFLKLNLD